MKSAPFKANEEYIQSEEGLKRLADMARAGKTMGEMASAFGVCRNTLYNWTKRYPIVTDTICEGKRSADDRVEESLYESCFGRSEREITIEKDENGTVVKQSIRTRYIPPNVTAIQYWLSNRRNDVWKARQQLEFSADSVLPIVIRDDLDTVKEVNLNEEDTALECKVSDTIHDVTEPSGVITNYADKCLIQDKTGDKDGNTDGNE